MSTIVDLNSYLFEQIEALTNDDLKGEALDEAIKRSKAVTVVADKIIDNARVTIEAVKIQNEYSANAIDPSVAFTPLLGEGK